MAQSNNIRGVCSYTMFRHSGGLSPDGILAVTTDYATFDGGFGPGNIMLFRDDPAAAEVPTRVLPKEGGFLCTAFQLVNDSAGSIFFSFDGIRDHFELKAGENILFDLVKSTGLFLRGSAAGLAYRLIVW